MAATVQQAKFAIGQVIHFQFAENGNMEGKSKKQAKKERRKANEEPWEVVKYHQVGLPPHWEVMFRSQWTGEHRSIPICSLEKYA